MNSSNLALTLIILLNFSSTLINGMDGTVIMQADGKRRKGDIIIIGGSGHKDVEEEVKYETKYTHVPVPIYIPQQPQTPKKIFIKVPIQIKQIPMPYQVPMAFPMKMPVMPYPQQTYQPSPPIQMPIKSMPIDEHFIQRMSAQSPKQYDYMSAQQIQHLEPIKGQVIDEIQAAKEHQLMPNMETGGGYDDWWAQ